MRSVLRKKLEKQRKAQNLHVVGFFRKDGKTRPITKSTAELNLNQIKFIKKPRGFKGIGPEKQKEEVESEEKQAGKPEKANEEAMQVLDDTLGKIESLEAEQERLVDERKRAQVSDVSKIDVRLKQVQREILNQQNTLKKLRV